MIFRFGTLFFQDPQLNDNFIPHFRDHGIIKTCGINRSRSVELVLKKSHGKKTSELGERSRKNLSIFSVSVKAGQDSFNSTIQLELTAQARNQIQGSLDLT